MGVLKQAYANSKQAKKQSNTPAEKPKKDLYGWSGVLDNIIFCCIIFYFFFQNLLSHLFGDVFTICLCYAILALFSLAMYIITLLTLKKENGFQRIRLGNTLESFIFCPILFFAIFGTIDFLTGGIENYFRFSPRGPVVLGIAVLAFSIFSLLIPWFILNRIYKKMMNSINTTQKD